MPEERLGPEVDPKAKPLSPTQIHPEVPLPIPSEDLELIKLKLHSNHHAIALLLENITSNNNLCFA